MMEDSNLGRHTGTAVSTDKDMFVTGHVYDIHENGVDHTDSCPCVNYRLPA